MSIHARPHLATQLTRLLLDHFGPLPEATLDLLRSRLQWQQLRAGETLVRQGEEGDSMALIVSGRLRALVQQDDGSLRLLREMGRGQVVGEMSLFTDEPRSATVVAVRDSLLARLDKPHFNELLESSAQASVALTRQIMQRLKTEHQTARHAAPVTIGLVPLTEGFDVAGFASLLSRQLARLGRVCVADVHRLRQHGQGADAMARALDELESTHDFVLLPADAPGDDWARLCRRHSDELLLLADTTRAVLPQAPAGPAAPAPPHAHGQPAEWLLLVHPVQTRSPQDSARWLALQPGAEHLHLRAGEPRDMARLARLLGRTAVGLVFSGGGARGFAHLGVLQALHERGIEVDCTGGTSIGAIMAALAATDQPLPRMLEVARQAFRGNPTGDFNPVPLMSLIRGSRLKAVTRQALRSLLGFEPGIEDLWKRHFAIATNYTLAREETLVRGPLAQALQASAAIPGALPPVLIDGSLLCDGGTFNNFPVDVMKSWRGIGCVIGVDLGQRQPPRRIALDELPGPWALLRDRLRPRRARRFRLPSLPTLLLNATILYSASRRQEAERLCDVYLNPPLFKVGLLEWKRFDAVVRQGYEHACEVLDRPEVARRLAGCVADRGVGRDDGRESTRMTAPTELPA